MAMVHAAPGWHWQPAVVSLKESLSQQNCCHADAAAVGTDGEGLLETSSEEESDKEDGAQAADADMADVVEAAPQQPEAQAAAASGGQAHRASRHSADFASVGCRDCGVYDVCV